MGVVKNRSRNFQPKTRRRSRNRLVSGMHESGPGSGHASARQDLLKKQLFSLNAGNFDT